jgi:glycosyltransferase involved in cell wall biosynthesis
MSGTVLVVTDFFPKDFAKAVHGVYQRLLTFAHAFRRPEDGIADACIRVLESDALARRLGDSARALAIARYSREKIIEKIRTECAF